MTVKLLSNPYRVYDLTRDPPSAYRVLQRTNGAGAHNSAAIQRALDLVGHVNDPECIFDALYLPGTSAGFNGFTMPPVSGIGLFGGNGTVGIFTQLSAEATNPPTLGSSCRLYYEGSQSGAAITYQSCGGSIIGVRVDGFKVLLGTDYNNARKQPKTAIGLKYLSAEIPGMPTCRLTAQMGFMGFQRAISVERASDSHNDHNLYGFVDAVHCDTFYYCDEMQAINHVFDFAHMYNVGTVFNFQAGGYIPRAYVEIEGGALDPGTGADNEGFVGGTNLLVLGDEVSANGGNVFNIQSRWDNTSKVNTLFDSSVVQCPVSVRLTGEFGFTSELPEPGDVGDLVIGRRNCDRIRFDFAPRYVTNGESDDPVVDAINAMSTEGFY